MAPACYLWAKLRTWGHDEMAFTPAALAEYQRCFADPAVIHASRKDKCVTTSIDLVYDEADLRGGALVPRQFCVTAPGIRVLRHC